MAEEKLGPMPDPEIEPPELHPGGADAVVDDGKYPEGDTVVARDLDPHPEAEEQVPEIAEPDDKQQEPESGESGEPSQPEEPSA